MPVAHVGPNDIYYELSGAGASPPVLLIMGFATDANGWERQVPALAAERRVLVLDNRGAGRSAKPRGPYSVDELADDALGVLEAAGLDGPVHLVGASLGGAIAQELTLRRPERVRSLALIATFTALDESMRASAREGAGVATGRAGVDLKVVVQSMSSGDASLDPRALLKFLMPLVFSRDFLERERETLKAMLERTLSYGVEPRGFAGQLAAALAHDTRERLGAIRAPTLVVTGDRDKLVPPAQSRAIAERIPGARLVEIEGGTHGLPLERAAELNALLSGWLREND